MTTDVEDDVAEVRVQFAKLLMWVDQLPLRSGSGAMLTARLTIIRDDVIQALRGE